MESFKFKINSNEEEKLCLKQLQLIGSSSLKWQLYQMPNEEVIAKGIVERIGLKDSIFTIKYGEGQNMK